MTSDATEQLNRTVGFVRQIVEHVYPNSVYPFSLFDYIETQDGFVLSTGSGATLIYGDVTDAAPGSWHLQMTSAVAFDVPLSPNVRIWTNEHNRQTLIGKYYYGVSGNGQEAAVMWETFLWSNLLELIATDGPQGQTTIRWVIENLNYCVENSSNVAHNFVDQFGGRVLQPTELDLMSLFKSSSG